MTPEVWRSCWICHSLRCNSQPSSQAVIPCSNSVSGGGALFPQERLSVAGAPRNSTRGNSQLPPSILSHSLPLKFYEVQFAASLCPVKFHEVKFCNSAISNCMMFNFQPFQAPSNSKGCNAQPLLTAPSHSTRCNLQLVAAPSNSTRCNSQPLTAPSNSMRCNSQPLKASPNSI